MPVSYTHLDVYKRQTQIVDSQSSACPVRKMYLKGVNLARIIFTIKIPANEIAISPPSPRFPIACPLIASIDATTLLRPVSYTHLDVYKRQALSNACRNRFPEYHMYRCGSVSYTHLQFMNDGQNVRVLIALGASDANSHIDVMKVLS